MSDLEPVKPYQVAARRWRPQLFRDVVAQAHVTETLQNAIRAKQTGHAYLFSGPRGVGKTTVARIFAKALNCVHGPAEEPCNVCPICEGIQSGASMDIHEMDGASNNSIEDVRNLIVSVGYHAGECRYKMYIIDEVHMLSTPAFNALLKTLEEPPDGVIFVFATTEPQKIPVTIISRCQRFDFHRLSVHDIAGKLRRIADDEGLAVDDASLLLIARRAGGAMRDGESILEQVKSSRGGSVTVADVVDILGIADREIFFSVMEKCFARDTAGALDLFIAYYDGGGDLKEFIEGLLGHLRDLLYGKFPGGLDRAPVSDDMRGRLLDQSARLGEGDIVRMITMLSETESSLSYAVLPVLRIETALARMASMDATIELRKLIELLEEGGPTGATGAVPSPASAPAGRGVPDAASPRGSRQDRHATTKVPGPGDGVPAQDERGMHPEPSKREGACSEISPDFLSIAAAWSEITDRVTALKPGVGPSLAKGTPESFEGGKLTVRFNSEDEFHMRTSENFRAEIEEIVGIILSVKVRLHVHLRSSGGERKAAGEVDDLIAREPIIRDIMDRFDGEINGQWR